jgi:hypothetical protein
VFLDVFQQYTRFEDLERGHMYLAIIIRPFVLEMTVNPTIKLVGGVQLFWWLLAFSVFCSSRLRGELLISC